MKKLLVGLLFALTALPAFSQIYGGSGCNAGTSGQIVFSLSGSCTSSVNLTYGNTASVSGGPQVKIGTGGAGSQGWYLGNDASGFSGIWDTSVTPSTVNFVLLSNVGTSTYLNASSNLNFSIGGAAKTQQTLTAFMPASNGAIDLGASATGFKRLYFDYTNTVIGTTGNQTINKASGRINIAAAGTTVTLTNSLVTANTQMPCFLMTVDTTAKTCVWVPGVGSAVATLNAAATGTVVVGFTLFNTD